MPDSDWDDPELAEAMADIAAELHALGELADKKTRQPDDPPLGALRQPLTAIVDWTDG